MADIFDSIDGFLSGVMHAAKAAPGKAREKTVQKVKEGKAAEEKPKRIEVKKMPIMPTRVSHFDGLLSDHGVERSSTLLISGGTGTGKTTFCLQSLYFGALNGERGVYISFEEEPEKVRAHMLKNYGWNFAELEKRGLMALVKYDPTLIARTVEGMIALEAGMLRIKIREMQLPIKPDRIVIDSLSALAIAFQEEENYRKYIRELFEMLEEYNSVNFVITETEQNPKRYSRSGVEEFLADGVVVFYSIKSSGKRKNYLEVIKLRSGKHVKEMVPYKMGPKGIEIEEYDKKF